MGKHTERCGHKSDGFPWFCDLQIVASLYNVNVYQRVSVDFVHTGEWEYEPTINDKWGYNQQSWMINGSLEQCG